MHKIEIIHFIKWKTVNSIIILLYATLLLQCNLSAYSTSKITLEIVNEMQSCEEQNLHYTIVKSMMDTSLTHRIVLPVFDNLLDNSTNNEMFFPAPALHRIRFTVEGYYGKKEHGNISDGCPHAHLFKITKIIKQEKVDSLYNFPIDNR